MAGKRAIGFRLTEETRHKLSIAAKARKPTANFTGHHHSEEAKAKMAAAKLGTTRIFTAEHRAKLSEARKRVCHKART